MKIRTKPSKNDDTIKGVGKKNELKLELKTRRNDDTVEGVGKNKETEKLKIKAEVVTVAIDIKNDDTVEGVGKKNDTVDGVGKKNETEDVHRKVEVEKIAKKFGETRNERKEREKSDRKIAQRKGRKRN